MTDVEWHPPGIDVTKPHPARVYNYWLAGKDNFEPDRELGDRCAAIFPTIRQSARDNRELLGRMVRFLIGEGVRQFVDLGTGIPTDDNTHEVAQRLDPHCRVLYVDNDPIVLAHARALLSSTPEGVTRYLDADVREVDRVLAEAEKVLDLSRPVAVTCLMTVQFLGDAEVFPVIAGYRDALGPGSYLALSAPTGDFIPAGRAAALMATYQAYGLPLRLRPRNDFAVFFTGLELVEPGIVPMTKWRPGRKPEFPGIQNPDGGYAAIGRKC